MSGYLSTSLVHEFKIHNEISQYVYLCYIFLHAVALTESLNDDITLGSSPYIVRYIKLLELYILLEAYLHRNNKIWIIT